MFTYVYLCSPKFTFFTYVYLCLPKFTLSYSSYSMSTMSTMSSLSTNVNYVNYFNYVNYVNYTNCVNYVKYVNFSSKYVVIVGKAKSKTLGEISGLLIFHPCLPKNTVWEGEITNLLVCMRRLVHNLFLGWNLNILLHRVAWNIKLNVWISLNDITSLGTIYFSVKLRLWPPFEGFGGVVIVVVVKGEHNS